MHDIPDTPPPKTGLVIGKFLPPHRGHQCLLDFARAYAGRLTVLVCSLKREPIPGELRREWVAEMCPGADVIHSADDNPSEPHEHPQFWDIWTATIRKRLPRGPDVVFSSESYGNELARRLGARHVVVDRVRELVPVSGTAIRQDPVRHWRYLPAPVRPYFIRRVCVMGPESTGKTTLCKRLAAHYGTAWVSEYARGHLDDKAAACEPADLAPIVRGQVAAEDAMARQAEAGVLFCDTDPLMTAMYAKLYYGACPDWLARAAGARRHDLYLVTDVDVPWVPDPQRDMPHRRAELLDRCLAELTSRGRPYVMVRGSWDERFETARQAVDEMLARPVG